MSASLARLLESDGFRVALAARNPEKLAGFSLRCDATEAAQVEDTFKAVEAKWGVPDLVVYNASYRTRGPFVELKAEEVRKTIEVTAFAGFLVAQAPVKKMAPEPRGSMRFAAACATRKPAKAVTSMVFLTSSAFNSTNGPRVR